MENLFRSVLVLIWIGLSAVLCNVIDKLIGYDVNQIVPATGMLHNVMQQLIGGIIVYLIVGGYIKKKHEELTKIKNGLDK